MSDEITHRLTGSLVVGFPGLKLRLGGAHTVANLLDEAGLPEKSPHESFAPELRRAEAPPDGDAREVGISFPSPTSHRNDLQLKRFPEQGVVVAAT